MNEWRLFEEGTIPEWTTSDWYAERESAPHLEQAGHHERLVMAAHYVKQGIRAGASSYSDFGAGDGGLLSLVKQEFPHLPAWGYDLQQTNVDAAAVRGVDVQLKDVVYDFDEIELGEVISVTEILEHLVNPHGFVSRLASAGSKWLIASSPYTENNESHYGFHTWAWDVEGYVKMVEDNGWNVVSVDTAWICTVLLAINQDRGSQ